MEADYLRTRHGLFPLMRLRPSAALLPEHGEAEGGGAHSQPRGLHPGSAHGFPPTMAWAAPTTTPIKRTVMGTVRTQELRAELLHLLRGPSGEE